MNALTFAEYGRAARRTDLKRDTEPSLSLYL